jgi:predicted dithiol-disulfide oxidoreductase (DUF899 family)
MREEERSPVTVGDPPVVSQDEWDEALEAMREREEAVGKDLLDLAAARKRMPMRPSRLRGTPASCGPVGW